MQGAVTSKVLRGIYAGHTKAEMLAIWAEYKRELADSGSQLNGSSVNGNSLQFGPRGDFSLTEWSRQIRFVLSQVDPDFLAPENSIVVRF